MAQRQPNRWTADEDATLYKEAMKQAAFGAIKDWSCIAALLPGRTNKDCRKRWINKVCGGLKRGAWSETEDRMLRSAVNTYGQRWTQVAKTCIGRSPDQCAKRWQFTLDPKLEHREWTSTEDKHLLQLVETFGRDWKLLCKRHYPTRSRNNLRNRYNTLTRRPLSEPSTSDRGNTDSPISLADVELNAEDTFTSDPDLVADAPVSSEYPDLNYTHSLWHAEDHAVELVNESSSFDGEHLLDLDLDFTNLLYPSSQSSESCENIDTIFSTCSSNVLSPKATESLAMELTEEDSYGDVIVGRGISQVITEDGAAMQCLIRETSSGDSHYENSPFSDDLNVATFCVTDVMQGVTGETEAPGGNTGSSSSVAKVVLLVEECDADTVKSLIDLTRRLRGKAKMTITV